MKLLDLLMTLDKNQYVIFCDWRKPAESRKTCSGRMKIGNINIATLHKMGNADVAAVTWSEHKNCFFVTITDLDSTKMSLAAYKVADTRMRQAGLIENGRVKKVF